MYPPSVARWHAAVRRAGRLDLPLTRPWRAADTCRVAVIILVGRNQRETLAVIIDLRTYKCLPGRTAAQLEMYGKYGYPIQQRYMGDALCYLVAESGGLNTLVHAWVYESAADREAKRARMAQDPDWKQYLVENGKAGHLIEQTTSLMTPAPFAPPLTVGKPKG